jgi:hypothetical protein
MAERQKPQDYGPPLVILEHWQIDLTSYRQVPGAAAKDIAETADTAIRDLIEEAAARLRLQQPDCGIHLTAQR